MCFQTDYSGYNFNQSENEINITQSVEAPHPPFEDNPKYQYDAAGKDGIRRKTVFLEQQTSRYKLSDTIHKQ